MFLIWLKILNENVSNIKQQLQLAPIFNFLLFNFVY